MGRVDDVINVSGHRIGTAEVEDAINQHPKVVESAVVGFPHEIKGSGIYAYVTCEPLSDDEAQNIENEIRGVVNKIIGPIAKPDMIQIVSDRTGYPPETLDLDLDLEAGDAAVAAPRGGDLAHRAFEHLAREGIDVNPRRLSDSHPRHVVLVHFGEDVDAAIRALEGVFPEGPPAVIGEVTAWDGTGEQVKL